MYSVRFENVKNTKKIQNSQEGRLRYSKKLRPAPFRKRRHRNFEKPHTPCASVGHVLRPAFPGGFCAPSGKAASGTAELTGKRLFPEKSRGCLRPHAAPRIRLRPSFRRAKPRPAGTAAARTGKNDATAAPLRTAGIDPVPPKTGGFLQQDPVRLPPAATAASTGIAPPVRNRRGDSHLRRARSPAFTVRSYRASATGS